MEKLWEECSKGEKRAVNKIESKAKQNHKNYKDGLIGETEYNNVKEYLLNELDRVEKKYEEIS